jgi:hypothetical protein
MRVHPKTRTVASLKSAFLRQIGADLHPRTFFKRFQEGSD